eukprot:NODE_475_length_6994_cov_1.213198.p2 type:complete len:192 gc:universal NODE_475_length_6994_cov_1.213198:6824-6249(-)
MEDQVNPVHVNQFKISKKKYCPFEFDDEVPKDVQILVSRINSIIKSYFLKHVDFKTKKLKRIEMLHLYDIDIKFKIKDSSNEDKNFTSTLNSDLSFINETNQARFMEDYKNLVFNLYTSHIKRTIISIDEKLSYIGMKCYANKMLKKYMLAYKTLSHKQQFLIWCNIESNVNDLCCSLEIYLLNSKLKLNK